MIINNYQGLNHKQKVGKYGEILAKNYLIKKGYAIIDTNKKTSYKEIDIIAKVKGILIFVEVKTRASQVMGLAEDNIGSRKIQNLKKAIYFYCSMVNHDPDKVRLDLIAIDIDKYKKTAKIKHYIDLF